jgi:hypothetical protein
MCRWQRSLCHHSFINNYLSTGILCSGMNPEPIRMAGRYIRAIRIHIFFIRGYIRAVRIHIFFVRRYIRAIRIHIFFVRGYIRTIRIHIFFIRGYIRAIRIHIFFARRYLRIIRIHHFSSMSVILSTMSSQSDPVLLLPAIHWFY